MITATRIALALLPLLLASGASPLERRGRLDHPAIREASGIVASRRHPGIFWVHNDSGNLPALYAVKENGALVGEFLVGAPNLDWEDIATDEAGRLYVGEIGNNDGRLPIRVIHRIAEPDPAQQRQGPLAVEATTYYRFPAGARFDAEGLFVDQGRAVVVAKQFDGTEAELWAIPLNPPAPWLKPALPQSLGRLPGFTEPATGADLSADGRRLAVCGNDVVRVYQRDALGPWQLTGTVRFRPDAIEAIAWNGRDLILASENRTLYRITEAAWRGREREKPTRAPARR